MAPRVPKDPFVRYELWATIRRVPFSEDCDDLEDALVRYRKAIAEGQKSVAIIEVQTTLRDVTSEALQGKPSIGEGYPCSATTTI